MIEVVRQMVSGWWQWWWGLPTGAQVGMVAASILWVVVMAYLMGSGQHYYKQEDGKLFVKEGRFGEWEEIGQHMKEKHNNARKVT